MKAEAFVIHLDRAVDRRAQAEALAAALPMPAHLLRAIDSDDLTDADIAAVYDRNLHRPRYPFDLRRQEVACFLSHRMAWQAIVDGDLDAGLVAEDDVDLDVTVAPEIVLDILRAIQPADYVRLPVKTGREHGPVVHRSGLLTLIEPRLRGLGMQAQIVGHEAARILLHETRRFDRPVDTMIQVPGRTAARVLSAAPVCFRHVDDAVGGSVVQKRQKPFGEIVEREIRRLAYRLAIAAMVRSSKAQPSL